MISEHLVPGGDCTHDTPRPHPDMQQGIHTTFIQGFSYLAASLLRYSSVSLRNLVMAWNLSSSVLPGPPCANTHANGGRQRIVDALGNKPQKL
jgi:hypothetical protein